VSISGYEMKDNARHDTILLSRIKVDGHRCIGLAYAATRKRR
jgi:hypothetical protein